LDESNNEPVEVGAVPVDNMGAEIPVAVRSGISAPKTKEEQSTVAIFVAQLGSQDDAIGAFG
jgi:hypothetical protein